MPNKIFGQLYFTDTVQAERSGDEKEDDTQAVTCPALDTSTKNLDLESDGGMLLKYIKILLCIHAYADKSSFYLTKLCMDNLQNVI